MTFLFAGCSPTAILLKGKLQRLSGNNMPSPDIPREEPPGFAGSVYFFELTPAVNGSPTGENGTYSMKGLRYVARAQADSLGQFHVKLRPGRYSVLIGRNGNYYANITDLDGTINPVTITRKETKLLVLQANWDAVY